MEIERKKGMEQKKNLILRPVAWICTIVMVLGLQLVAELLCRLGGYLVLWVSGLSTAAIIVLVLIFGGLFCSLFFYSAILLPSFLVTVSDKIYPSNQAVRYFFAGIWEVAGCAFLITMAAAGAVSGGSMFWFYARHAWLILASIIMMVAGNNEAKERHRGK